MALFSADAVAQNILGAFVSYHSLPREKRPVESNPHHTPADSRAWNIRCVRRYSLQSLRRGKKLEYKNIRSVLKIEARSIYRVPPHQNTSNFGRSTADDECLKQGETSTENTQVKVRFVLSRPRTLSKASWSLHAQTPDCCVELLQLSSCTLRCTLHCTLRLMGSCASAAHTASQTSQYSQTSQALLLYLHGLPP